MQLSLKILPKNDEFNEKPLNYCILFEKRFSEWKKFQYVGEIFTAAKLTTYFWDYCQLNGKYDLSIQCLLLDFESSGAKSNNWDYVGSKITYFKQNARTWVVQFQLSQNRVVLEHHLNQM